MNARFAILLLALSGGCASAPPAPPLVSALFEFHSSFWVNLHHDLLAQARPKAPARSEPAWSADERTAWQAAVEHYRKHLVEKSPLFDRGMGEIRDHLAALPDTGDRATTDLEPALGAVLASAAPVYRRHFWPDCDAANRRASAHLAKLVSEHPEFVDRLTIVLETPWPETPVRVDLVADADWAGAYTTILPTHITIAAEDPRHQGDAGLEVLFHEAAHGLFRHVSNAIDAEVTKQGVTLPRRDLWHAVLFYTVGELARRDLPAGYLPYAEKQGLYRGPWGDYQRALEAHWRPYLNGEISLAMALERMVAGVGVRKPSGLHRLGLSPRAVPGRRGHGPGRWSRA